LFVDGRGITRKSRCNAGDLIWSRRKARKRAGRAGRLRRGAAAAAVVVVTGGFRSVPWWKSSPVVAITGTAALGRTLQGGLPRDSRAHLSRCHTTHFEPCHCAYASINWPPKFENLGNNSVWPIASLGSNNLSVYRRILRVIRLFGACSKTKPIVD